MSIDSKKSIFLIGDLVCVSEEKEIEFAKKYSVKTISLGSHITRWQTAAIAITANAFFYHIQKDISFLLN